MFIRFSGSTSRVRTNKKNRSSYIFLAGFDSISVSSAIRKARLSPCGSDNENNVGLGSSLGFDHYKRNNGSGNNRISFFFFGWRNCSHPKPAQGSAPGHRSITIDQSIIPINSAQNLDKKNCIDELKSSATDWARTVECILRHSWMHYAIILKFFDASFMNHKLWFSTKFTTLMSKLLEKKKQNKILPICVILERADSAVADR